MTNIPSIGKNTVEDSGFSLQGIMESDITAKACTDIEDPYKKLFEFSPIGMFILDMNGVILYCNPAGYERSGYTMDDFTGKHFSELVALQEGDASKLFKIFKSIKNGESIEPFEFPFKRKDGSEGFAEVYATLLDMGAGKSSILVYKIDASKRRKVEELLSESEDKFSKAFRSSPNVCAISRLRDNVILDINDSFAEITGYTREEVINKSSFYIDFWVNLEQRDKIIKIIREQGSVSNEICDFRVKSGEIRKGLVSVQLCNIDGEKCMVFVSIDITERYKAEQALRENEEFSSRLLEEAPNPISVVNPDTSLKYVNPAFERLTGYTLPEIQGIKIPYPWWPKEKREERTTDLQGSFKLGDTLVDEIVRKDGERLLVELNLVPVKRDNEVAYYLSHWKDITDKRKADEALKQERNRAQNYFNIAGTMLVALDTKGIISLINAKGCETLGYEEADIIGMNWFDNFVPPNRRSELKDDYQKWMAGDTRPEGYHENRVITKSGEEKIIAWHTKEARDENGSLIGTLGSGDDITDLKQAELALKASEEKFRDLFENAIVLIQSLTPDGYFRYVNNHWKKILGYEDEEISKLTVFDIVHPDYLQQYKKLFNQVMDGENIGLVEAAFISKSGKKVNVEGNFTCKFEDGGPVYTRGVFHDITERKYLERDVSRLSSAVSMSTDSIVITDFDARIVDVNQSTLENFGADAKEEMLGIHFLELVDPSERAKVNMDVKTIMEEGKLEAREYVMVSRDGNKFVMGITTSLVRDAEGQPMGLVRVGKRKNEAGMCKADLKAKGY